ncbi:hypothetical protein GCM10022408_06000 [Hymenobacter fastidiosus]|uniref:Uncharacterized protein n=1 Tax=Hymenobacter fastidiosus TaxID=486264 RepID=A0ABP7RIM2_9BACT
MAKNKHKKKRSKSADDVADDLFSIAAQSVRQFRKVTNEIARLSTGQKLAGGTALLAAGLLYLNKRKQDTGGSGFSFRLPQLATAQVVEPSDDEAWEAAPARPASKGHKHTKAGLKPGKAHRASHPPSAHPDKDA